MKSAEESSKYIMRAIELARNGEGHTRPNPPVGAVIVKNGIIVGEGWHHRCGCDHAEVDAIKNAGKNFNGNGATIYVTLEPCSKPGRVGACTDAIKAAGISRVVYAVEDPNPKNRGKAKKSLAEAGIKCSHMRSCVAVTAAKQLIAPFAKFMTQAMPYVTVKMAMTLDGRICDDWHDAKWISSADSRRTTGKLRERVDAVMVGAGTLRYDNPSLLSHGTPNDDLLRIIVTSSGNLPLNSQVFTDEARKRTFILCVGWNHVPESLIKLTEPDGIGAVIASPSASLADALKLVSAKTGCMHILCEGGIDLARSLAEEELVDEWITVLAPKVIGHRHICDAAGFAGADTFISYCKLQN